MPPQPAPAHVPDDPKPTAPSSASPVADVAPATPRPAPEVPASEEFTPENGKPLGDVPELPASPLPPSMPPQPSGSGRRLLPIFLIVGGAMLLLVLLVVGAYQLGKKAKTAAQPTAMQQSAAPTLIVPKDATITAECAEARGKQYIIPKNIPTGPIYDVYQGKVVAIEYLIGETELNGHAGMFDNLPLPHASYDHMMVMPMEAHAGENEAHFHVVSYLITKAAAAKITCAGQSVQMTGTM